MSKSPSKDEARPADKGGVEPEKGPELRLMDRKAFVGLGAFDVAPHVKVSDLSLQIPNVTFPFNVTGGAQRFQKQRCLFGQLDLELAPVLVKDAEKKIGAGAPELSRFTLALRAGFIEAEGALRAGGKEPVPFTCRIAFDGEGEGVAALVFDVRLYAPCEVPAPLVARAIAHGALASKVAPGLTPRGLGAVAASPLSELLRRTVPQKGFRLPDSAAARLGSALVAPRGITLRFSAGAPPPGGLADEDLLLAVEGAHAFSEGEQLLESGELTRAREWFLRAGELAQAHPFAVERLISLLLGDPDVADYALDLTRALAQRRPLSPAPLWFEGLLRWQRREPVIAATRFLELAALARGRGEEASAFWAAQAAAQVARSIEAPRPQEQQKLVQLGVRALQEALGLRPDHFPSLVALAEGAERAGDDAAALRAWRRLTAVAREPALAARAHVRLGALCARVDSDMASARLHLDAALRLEPDDAEALLGLADLCARSGEPLRALKALDRVRELNRHDGRLLGRAELEAGAVHEHGLGQLENARLRYQEAARALPGDPEPLLRRGEVDERLGRVEEAVEGLHQALELLGPNPGEKSHLAHRGHRALARIARDRTHDGNRHRLHLEEAVRLHPEDFEAWEELVPLFRADDAHARLAEALGLAARRVPETRRRVAMLVESAELFRLRLGEPEKARKRYAEALESDARSREALEGLLALEEAAGEVGPSCERLRALVELTPPGRSRLPLLRRLAVAARDGKKDLELAARTTREILALVPDDASAQSELVTLQRRRADLPALAEALEGWARACERSGDVQATAAALRELASLYDGRLGRTDDGLSALEKAHGLAPSDMGVLSDLSEMALRAGRHRLARYASRALLSLLGETAPAPQRAALLDRQARAAEALGDLDEAGSALEEAWSLATDDSFAERLDLLLAQLRRDEARCQLARRRGSALTREGRSSLAARVLSDGAVLARSLGDVNAAQKDFANALSADPAGPFAAPALEALTELALGRGQASEAAGHLARWAQLSPEPRAAAQLLFRAAHLVANNDEPRSLQLLSAAAHRDGRFAPARAALAQRRARSGDVAQAAIEAEAALDVDPRDADALPPTEQAQLERSASRWADQAGDLGAAHRLLVRYLARRPDDVSALADRVGLLRRLNEFESLAAALESWAARLAPDEAAHAIRELARLQAGPLRRLDAAIVSWRRVVALSPEDREALLALADLLVGPAELEERVAVFKRLAVLAPSADEAGRIHLRRGQVLWGALRHADALEAFRAASTSLSDAAPALDALVACADEAGLTKPALDARTARAELAARRAEPDAGPRLLDVANRLFEAGIALEGESTLRRLLSFTRDVSLQRSAHERLVESAEARGELSLALVHQLARVPLAAESERVGLLQRAAALALALDDREGARSAVMQALTLAPRSTELLRTLVQVQQGLGDVEGQAEALAQLAERVETADERGSLWLNAAGLLEAIGARSRAEAALRRALWHQPSLPAAQLALSTVLLGRGAWNEGLELAERHALTLAHPVRAADALAEGARLAAFEAFDGSRALRLVRLALGKDAGHPAATRLGAELTYLAGARDEAISLLERAWDQADLDAEPERIATWALQLHELRLDAGHPEAATPYLQLASERAPWRTDLAMALHSAEAAVDPIRALERLRVHVRALHEGTGRYLALRRAADAAMRIGDRQLTALLLEEALPSAGVEREELEARLIPLHLSLSQPFMAVALLRGQADRLLQNRRPALARAPLIRAAELLEQATAAGQAAECWAEIASIELSEGRLVEGGGHLVRRARLLRDALNEPAEAERELRRAIELDPSSVEAVREAVALFAARGDAAGEMEMLALEDERVSEGSRRAEVLFRRAELLHLKLGRTDEAEVALRRALTLSPRFGPARDLWEELLTRSGRHAELAQSRLGRVDEAMTVEARLALLREAAALFVRAEALERAADALDQARSLDPENLELALESAAAHAASGRDEAAELVDVALLAKDPTLEAPFARELARRVGRGDLRGQAQLQQSRALEEQGSAATDRFLLAADLHLAVPDLEAAKRCELWAFERDARSALAFQRVRTRHEGPAHRRVLDGILRRRAAAVESEAAQLHLERGRIAAASGEDERAIEALDEALTVAEADSALEAEVLLLRADLEDRLQGHGAAARFDARLVDAPALEPAVRRRVAVRLGQARVAEGDDDGAAALWERALEGAEPTLALSIVERLVEVHARRRDDAAQARAVLRRSELVPAEAISLLAEVERLDGAGDLALEALRRRSALDDDGAVWLRLARLELARSLPEGRERLVEAARHQQLGSTRAQLLVEASLLLEQAGESARAVELRREARAADPRNLEALRLGADDLRTATGDVYGERREVLSTLIDLEGDREARAALRSELATLVEPRDPGEALGHLLAWDALRVGEARREPLARAEAICRAQGRRSELAEILERLAEALPAESTARELEAARLWRGLAQPLKARAALTRAAHGAPEAPAPWLGLAELASETNDHAEEARASEAWAERVGTDALRAEGLSRAGRAWERADRFGAALEAWQRVAGLELPAAARLEAHREVARLAQLDGKRELALVALQAALAVSSRPEEQLATRLAAARLADELGDDGAAASLWLDQAEAVPTDVEAVERLRTLLARRGEWSVLAARLERHALALEPAVRGAIWREAAALWLRLREEAKAQAALRAAAVSGDGQEADWSQVLELAERRDDVAGQEEALVALGASRAPAAERAVTFTRLAALHGRLGRTEAELAALRDAVACTPDGLEALDRLVTRLEQERRFDEAADRLSAHGDLSLASRRRLAAALAAAGRLEETTGVLLDALVLSPDDRATAEALASHVEKLPSAARAAAVREWAERAVPEQRVGLWMQVAGLSEGASRREALEQAFEADASQSEAFSALHHLHVQAGDDAALAQLLERRADAVSDGEDRGALWQELGELRSIALSDDPGAFDAYERSLLYRPGHLAVELELAELAFRLGRPSRARQLWLAVEPRAEATTRLHVWEQLALLAEQGGDALEAAGWLRRRVEAGQAGRAHGLAWRRLAAAGHDAEAEEAALAFLVAHGGSKEELAGWQGELCDLAERRGDALVAAQHLAARLALVGDELEGFRRLLELAERAHAADLRLDAATQLAALESTPHARAMAWLLRARLLAELGRFEEACDAAFAAEALTPGDELALLDALHHAQAGQLQPQLARAGRALFERSGAERIRPWAEALVEACEREGDVKGALTFAEVVLEGAPEDRTWLTRAATLAERLGDEPRALRLARREALLAPATEAARTLRRLAQRAEREPADPALAFGLWEQAFARGTADDAEAEAQSARAARLGEHRAAAHWRAELARRFSAQPERWSALLQAGTDAGRPELVEVAQAVEAFLRGALPDAPSRPQSTLPLQPALLRPLGGEPVFRALLEAGRARWGRAPAAPAGLRPAGPVLLGRLGTLAEALGVAAPGCVMDPSNAQVGHAGPDRLVVGIGLFTLPARAQDMVLARALVRGALGLASAGAEAEAHVAEALAAAGLAGATHPAALEALADALATAVVADPLAAIAGRTLAEPTFAQADFRSWDRKLAFAGPGQKGAAAALTVALARAALAAGPEAK